MRLWKLILPKGTRSDRKRKGRGNASGNGKTSGRGHKGLKARAGGKVRAGFEGGQMPLYRRLPKFGFISKKKQSGVNQYNIINLKDLNSFDSGAIIDPQALQAKGYGTNSSCKAGIKLLGNGKLEKKLTIKVHAASQAACAAIEEAGGTVELISKVSSSEVSNT